MAFVMKPRLLAVKPTVVSMAVDNEEAESKTPESKAKSSSKADRREPTRVSSSTLLVAVAMVLGFTILYTLGTAYWFASSCIPESHSDVVISTNDPNDVIRAQRQNIAAIQAQLQAEQQLNNDLRRQSRSQLTADAVSTGSQTELRVQAALERLDLLLPSSVYCIGQNRSDRICEFHNLYYNRLQDRFFVVVGPSSVFVNAPENPSVPILDLSSLDDHTSFYFAYDEVAVEAFRNVQVEIVDVLTFVFARFHPFNIMHVLHDDLINLFHLMTRYHAMTTGPIEIPFSIDHQIQLMDIHDNGPYSHLMTYFTNRPLRFRQDLQSTEITCFRLAVVGQSKLTSWYQYGFTSPQGPIKTASVSGGHVRSAVNYLLRSINLLPIKDTVASEVSPWAVIFSRTKNRRILNQEELIDKIRADFDLPVKVVSMEEHSFEEQVAILRRTKVAIGLHGSILIMAVFMPPGAVLVELYPFAVPAENYTPYKTMSNLKGMGFVYKSWVNTHEDKNVPHPDWPRLMGGIQHLPQDQQQKILDTKTVPSHVCCEDPYWLFRIYQDTTVDVNEVAALVKAGLRESESAYKPYVKELRPAMITKFECKNIGATEITLSWSAPWNGARITGYSIWHHQTYKSYIVSGAGENNAPATTLTIQNLTVATEQDFWIRVVQDEFIGPYSKQLKCRLLDKNSIRSEPTKQEQQVKLRDSPQRAQDDTNDEKDMGLNI